MVMQRPNLLVLALLLSFAAPRSIRAGGAFSLESDHEEARARGSKPSYSPMLADLSTLSFDHNVGNGSTWFVMLYAPWCGLCKANKPKLVDVAEHYAGNSSVSIGMVDATLQLSLAVRFGVTSFPKFVLVEGGSTYRVYDRVAPPAEAIIDFIDNDAYSDSVLVSGALNPFNPQSPLHRGALFFHPLRVLLYAIDSYILPLEPTTRLGVAPVMVPDPTAQRPSDWNDEEDGVWGAPLVKDTGPPWYANGPWLYNVAIVLTLVYPIYWYILRALWFTISSLVDIALPPKNQTSQSSDAKQAEVDAALAQLAKLQKQLAEAEAEGDATVLEQSIGREEGSSSRHGKKDA